MQVVRIIISNPGAPFRAPGWPLYGPFWALWGSIGDTGNIAKTDKCVCKSIRTFNLKNWEGQKLRRNIKIRGGLVMFKLHFGKRKSLHS